ncbi:SAP domain-containing protein [Paenibacillus sp. NPDC058174]|uniref:SAP domain-containing protein n=1 Tax=Paenibacillus sp. NPDC058174 TaxID=3346366 RepID=UPI0036D99161
MTGHERPPFSKALTVQQFELHYWYKNELINVCKTHNIPASGTKAELEERIKKWLAGEEMTDHRQAGTALRKKKQESHKELTLSTKLIPDGFKFNQQARNFFASYYKKQKFSFTKEMAALLREAKRRGDMEMTIADLIEVYEGKTSLVTSEEKTYQWNNFVKDLIKTRKQRQSMTR